MNELQKAVTAAFNTTFTFYFKAHAFHWNVEGKDFQEYHDLFGSIYEEVYDIIDSFAERIRTTQAYAPGSLSQILSGSRIMEEGGVPTLESMTTTLLQDNEKVVAALKVAYDACEAAGEHGFSNFLSERMDGHRKHGWKLRASLNG